MDEIIKIMEEINSIGERKEQIELLEETQSQLKKEIASEKEQRELMTGGSLLRDEQDRLIQEKTEKFQELEKEIRDSVEKISREIEAKKSELSQKVREEISKYKTEDVYKAMEQKVNDNISHLENAHNAYLKVAINAKATKEKILEELAKGDYHRVDALNGIQQEIDQNMQYAKSTNQQIEIIKGNFEKYKSLKESPNREEYNDLSYLFSRVQGIYYGNIEKNKMDPFFVKTKQSIKLKNVESMSSQNPEQNPSQNQESKPSQNSEQNPSQNPVSNSDKNADQKIDLKPEQNANQRLVPNPDQKTVQSEDKNQAPNGEKNEYKNQAPNSEKNVDQNLVPNNQDFDVTPIPVYIPELTSKDSIKAQQVEYYASIDIQGRKLSIKLGNTKKSYEYLFDNSKLKELIRDELQSSPVIGEKLFDKNEIQEIEESVGIEDLLNKKADLNIVYALIATEKQKTDFMKLGSTNTQQELKTRIKNTVEKYKETIMDHEKTQTGNYNYERPISIEYDCKDKQNLDQYEFAMLKDMGYNARNYANVKAGFLTKANWKLKDILKKVMNKNKALNSGKSEIANEAEPFNVISDEAYNSAKDAHDRFINTLNQQTKTGEADKEIQAYKLGRSQEKTYPKIIKKDNRDDKGNMEP